MEVIRVPAPHGANARTGETAQTARDNETINARRRALGQTYFDMEKSLTIYFQTRGQAYNRITLLNLASDLIKRGSKPHLDRLANRGLPALLCWFGENCPEFLSITAAQPMPAEGYDSDPGTIWDEMAI
jgi:hypothetical protein